LFLAANVFTGEATAQFTVSGKRGSVELMVRGTHETRSQRNAQQRLAFLDFSLVALANLQTSFGVVVVVNRDPDVSTIRYHILANLSEFTPRDTSVGQAGTPMDAVLVQKTNLVRFARVALARGENLFVDSSVAVVRRVEKVLKAYARNVGIFGRQSSTYCLS
jgi:hypothetical protein